MLLTEFKYETFSECAICDAPMVKQESTLVPPDKYTWYNCSGCDHQCMSFDRKYDNNVEISVYPNIIPELEPHGGGTIFIYSDKTDFWWGINQGNEQYESIPRCMTGKEAVSEFRKILIYRNF
jgi:hypothetical protein